MTSASWKLEVERWPGPDRQRWHITRDEVVPSPDGRFACVVYSCNEIRLHWEAGLLALLAGPPEGPTVVLRPRGFHCLDASPIAPAQWLGGSRFVVVTHVYETLWKRGTQLAFTFLDTFERRFAKIEVVPGAVGKRFVETDDEWVIPVAGETPGEQRIARDALEWKDWRKLRG